MHWPGNQREILCFFAKRECTSHTNRKSTEGKDLSDGTEGPWVRTNCGLCFAVDMYCSSVKFMGKNDSLIRGSFAGILPTHRIGALAL